MRLVGQRKVAVSDEVLARPPAAVVHSTALGVAGVLVVQAAVGGHVGLRVQRRLRGVQVVLRVHQVAVARFHFCVSLFEFKAVVLEYIKILKSSLRFSWY